MAGPCAGDKCSISQSHIGYGSCSLRLRSIQSGNTWAIQSHTVRLTWSGRHTVFAIQSLPYSHVNICPAAARAISIGGPWSHQPIQQSKQQTNQPNQKVKEPTRPVSSKSPTDQMPNPRKTKSPYRQKNQICSIHPISHLR